MLRRKTVALGVTVLVVALVVASAVVAVVTGGAQLLLRSQSGLTPQQPSSASAAPASPGATVSANEPTTGGLPAVVLPPAISPATPVAAKVLDRLATVDDLDISGVRSAAVVDVASGRRLYGRRADSPRTPASTMKVLTSIAALDVLGPDHVFSTKVANPERGTVVLVGGGDPYLASRTTEETYPRRSSLADLAAATAVRLRSTGQTSVAVGYDATLFSGPSWSPSWPASYRDQVTAVSALWADEGRLSGGSPGPRRADPARAAGRVFAKALRRHGIRVTSVAVERARASDPMLAAVESMPLERIVEQLLLVSDNDAAEVLLRQVAIATGRPGSFSGGRAAMREILSRLGAWEPGTAIHDGSGLSRRNRVAATTLTTALRLAATEDRPQLRAVLTGLPVAGVEGSLRFRFTGEPSAAGVGLVHAKTGTLRGVHTLAGLLRTRDGSLMAFAFLVNNTRDDFAATVWLDRVAAALAGCGCR